MNRTKKKHIGLILLFCIGVLFGASPIDWGTSFALAAEPDEDYTEAEARWQTAEDGEWHEGSFLKAMEDVYAGGTIELLSNVSLTGGISVNKPVRVRSYDISAPCTILNQTAEPKNEDNVGEIFTVKGGNFFLEHIILDGGREEGRIVYHPLISVTNGQLTLGAGAVLQNNENADEAIGGGGLRVSGSGIALMADGSKITGCKAKNGGGVEAAAGGMPCFVMYTGSLIENCQALDGGGVYVNKGGFLMMGGQIKGNQATGKEVDQGGGGIFIKGIKNGIKARVQIQGGEIVGNKAEFGGGILVHSESFDQGILEISGGTIRENKAKCAGGIYISKGVMGIFDGLVTENRADIYGGGILVSSIANVQMRGNPRVINNYSGSEFDNFYLDGREDDNPSETTRPIELIGALGDGADIGLSRWVRPDEGDHPGRVMISPKGYTISEDDLARLHADNQGKYGLIRHQGNVLLVLAVDVELDKHKITFFNPDETDSLEAKVTPDNAIIKDVTWSSDDETVATVDADGVVTAVGEGRATITVTTVSPYNATASCRVTVGSEFELIEYPVAYQLEGGELKENETNPDFYTDESDTIVLKNPIRKGYSFVGWIGTDLQEPALEVTIPTGSKGARSYRAVWKADEVETPHATATPEKTPEPERTPEPESTPAPEKTPEPERTSEPESTPEGMPTPESTPQNMPMETPQFIPEESSSFQEASQEPPEAAAQETWSRIPKLTSPLNRSATASPSNSAEPIWKDSAGKTEGQASGTDIPQTGSNLFLWYIAAAVSAAGLLILLFLNIKNNRRNLGGKRENGKKYRHKKKKRHKKK